MKNIMTFLLGIITFSFFACFEDDGNYDYKDLNTHEITIRFSSYTYSAYAGEPVVFKPQVIYANEEQKTSGDTNMYKWSYYFDDLGCVCTERDMNVVLSGVELNKAYDGIVIAEDTLTGAYYSQRISFSYTSQYKVGWVILSDNGGKSTLNLVRLQNGEWYTDKDIYQTLYQKGVHDNPCVDDSDMVRQSLLIRLEIPDRRQDQREHSRRSRHARATASHTARIRLSARRVGLGVRGSGDNGSYRERKRHRDFRNTRGVHFGQLRRGRSARRSGFGGADDKCDGDRSACADSVHRVQYADDPVFCGSRYRQGGNAGQKAIQLHAAVLDSDLLRRVVYDISYRRVVVDGFYLGGFVGNGHRGSRALQQRQAELWRNKKII